MALHAISIMALRTISIVALLARQTRGKRVCLELRTIQRLFRFAKDLKPRSIERAGITVLASEVCSIKCCSRVQDFMNRNVSLPSFRA